MPHFWVMPLKVKSEELDTAWYSVPEVLPTETVMGVELTIRPLGSQPLLTRWGLPS